VGFWQVEMVVVEVGRYVGVGGGGEELQKCSFGRGSRMIRARSRMIRAGQLRSGMARDELENGDKSKDFVDFGWIARWRWWGKV